MQVIKRAYSVHSRADIGREIGQEKTASSSKNQMSYWPQTSPSLHQKVETNLPLVPLKSTDDINQGQCIASLCMIMTNLKGWGRTR